jgi:DNA-binding NarL/FixJ family response regulator
MADDDRAGFEFEASIGYLEQTLMRIDLMVTHLLYGEWLRRQTRLHEARVHLREAYEAFADMGAERLAQRSRAELMATGEKVPRRTKDSMNNLTPQELRIAQMASRGATNPEIAAQLFISSSTVDYHLRKVYRKLDITSRRQLERALQPLV